MRELTEILGVPFDVGTMDMAVNKAMKFFEEDKFHTIFTPNPEIVMEAQDDVELMKILKNADMVIPDGIGVVWASKYSKKKLPERVAGFDFSQKIMKEMGKKNMTAYFFGGAPGVTDIAAQKMEEKYAGLKVVGTRNGYFKKEDEAKIIKEIKSLNPDLLLVGLGAPKQEKWIYNNLEAIGVKVAVGVGGSFDVMAGTVKRAPKLFQKLGLEWFYRLISQPTRAKRMMRLPKFVVRVLANKGTK